MCFKLGQLKTERPKLHNNVKRNFQKVKLNSNLTRNVLRPYYIVQPSLNYAVCIRPILKKNY